MKRELVRERLTALNLQTVCDDVSLFLERPQDASLLTRDNLEVLLRDIPPAEVFGQKVLDRQGECDENAVGPRQREKETRDAG